MTTRPRKHEPDPLVQPEAWKEWAWAEMIRLGGQVPADIDAVFAMGDGWEELTTIPHRRAITLSPGDWRDVLVVEKGDIAYLVDRARLWGDRPGAVATDEFERRGLGNLEILRQQLLEERQDKRAS